MKSKLTNNLGLKILSLLVSIFLWLIVVNVDDPIISKTYNNVPVDILNQEILTSEGKCFEIVGGRDAITVVVSAKRSILDQMSKDYIRATANMKDLSADNQRIPIEIRSTRYSDQIESVTSRIEYLNVNIENVIDRTVPVHVLTTGVVEENHVISEITTSNLTVDIKGPESVVNLVDRAVVRADVSDMSEDTTLVLPIGFVDSEDEEFESDKMTCLVTDVRINILIDQVKEIPISGGTSGVPADGYGHTGAIFTEPTSVKVSGRGENFDDLNVIYILPEEINITGASSDVVCQVDISEYLPSGVKYADPDFDKMVDVVAEIKELKRKTIEILASNISVTNLPDGYVAKVVDPGIGIPIEIQGIGDTFDRFDGALAMGSIDATALVPRIPSADVAVGAMVPVGDNDGQVVFSFPSGVKETVPLTLEVIVDYIGTGGLTDISAGAVGGTISMGDASAEGQTADGTAVELTDEAALVEQ